MYEIRSSLNKGFGVFACQLIPRGTRIFSEAPLVALRPDQSHRDLYSAFKVISAHRQRELLQLSTHVTTGLSLSRWGEALWYSLRTIFTDVHGGWRSPVQAGSGSLSEHVRILSVFRNNSFMVSTPHIKQAVFPRISRLNHSCVPNAQGNFHPGLGKFNVHALKDIGDGEEVSISYLPESGSPREARQEALNGWGFACACEACDVEKGRVGEEARMRMQSRLKVFAEGDGQGELATTKELILLFEEQGTVGRELSTLSVLSRQR